MEIVLLGLLALAIPICGIAGFVMALNLRARATWLEQRLALLEAQVRGLGAAPVAAPELGQALPSMSALVGKVRDLAQPPPPLTPPRHSLRERGRESVSLPRRSSG